MSITCCSLSAWGRRANDRDWQVRGGKPPIQWLIRETQGCLGFKDDKTQNSLYEHGPGNVHLGE